MSPFLRNVLAQREREQLSELLARRGREIPGESPGNPGRAANEELRDTILRMTRMHPDWPPTVIAEECHCAAITVRKVQRAAGVFREPIRVGGNKVVMP